MSVDTDLLRAARNAFLLILVTLLGISAYQFATRGAITAPVLVVWIVGAAGFYLSKWYYARQEGGEHEGAEKNEEGETEADSSAAVDAETD